MQQKAVSCWPAGHAHGTDIKTRSSPCDGSVHLDAGVTSENVAAKYGIAREVQDKMAVSSHQRAAKARETGRFKEEIVPVKTIWKDPKSGV